MVIAVVALAFCSSFTITAFAQTYLPPSHSEMSEQKISIDFAVTGQKPPIDGGFVNLNYAMAAEVRAFKLSLRPAGIDGDGNGKKENDKLSLDIPTELTQPLPDNSFDQVVIQSEQAYKFRWGSALKQSLLFLGIMHSYRLITEEGTRADLKGPFWKDYTKSLRSLRGWEDGDPFIVNYIGHPMQGSVSGFIQIHNDPKGMNEEISLTRSYWISRLKAFGWSALFSTQFELGLVSEATIGNIGIRPYRKAKHPMAYVDLVVTPVVGTSWLIGEDLLDRYFIRRYETRLPNRTTVIIFRSILNPTRGFANEFRLKWPWYRDNRF